MRLAFFGAPAFAVPSLAAVLEAGHEVARVYSQPDAPAGRGQAPRPTPVSAFAISKGLPLARPASLREGSASAGVASLGLDAVVVVAFGQILPTEVLDAPRLGAFNLHASLLPRWRGAAPIQRAIMAGDTVTGVQVMRMTAGLDEGPILASRVSRIDALETAGSLHDRLAAAGAVLLAETLAAIAAGEATETRQAADGATYARKLRRRETELRWDRPAREVDRQIRALSPHPGAWFVAPGGRRPVRVKALLSSVAPLESPRAPAGVIVPGGGLAVACAEGVVQILRAQREGRAPQEIDDFLRGFPIPAGARLRSESQDRLSPGA